MARRNLYSPSTSPLEDTFSASSPCPDMISTPYDINPETNSISGACGGAPGMASCGASMAPSEATTDSFATFSPKVTILSAPAKSPIASIIAL